MSWIEKLLPPRINKTSDSGARRVPEGLWVKCPSCETVLYSEDLAANLHVCPKCDHHMRIGARARIDSLLDLEGRVEIGQSTRSVDTLKFKDTRKYPERLAEAVKQTGETDALVVVSGSIRGVPATLACFEFEFMGAPWVRWSASASRVAPRLPWTTRRPSSVSPLPVARACRKACCR